MYRKEKDFLFCYEECLVKKYNLCMIFLIFEELFLKVLLIIFILEFI